MKAIVVYILLTVSTVNFLAVSAPILLRNRYISKYFIKWINYVERMSDE